MLANNGCNAINKVRVILRDGCKFIQHVVGDGIENVSADVHVFVGGGGGRWSLEAVES